MIAEEAFQNEKENFEEDVHIYVGTSAPKEEANIEEELEDMDGDGFLIRPQNNTITIIGPTGLGTQNGGA